jgi:branched-chain amino acid transport system substrate-binding protein
VIRHARFLRLAVLLLSVAVSSPVLAATAGEPVELTVILPLTGAGAFIGQQESLALRAAERWANDTGGIGGRPVHFTVRNDETVPQQSVQMVSALLQTALILGPSSLATCNAVAPIVGTGPVTYCLSPGLIPKAGTHNFVSSVSVADLQTAALRYMHGRGWNRIAVLTSTDASGQDGERSVDEGVALPENRGMQVIDREHFAPTDISVTAQLTRIKESKPDVLIAWSIGTPFGTILRAVNEVGLNVPIYTGNGNMTLAQMKAYANILPAQLYFPSFPFAVEGLPLKGPLKAASDRYHDAFTKIGVQPDMGASFAWDPVMIAIDALRHVGPAATADQINDYIEHLHGFAGINGVYAFSAADHRGVDGSSVVIARWDATKGDWVAASSLAGKPLR